MKKLLFVIAIGLFLLMNMDIFYKQKNPVEKTEELSEKEPEVVEKLENNKLFSDGKKDIDSSNGNEVDRKDATIQSNTEFAENSEETKYEPIANTSQTIPEKGVDKNTEIPKSYQKDEVDIEEKVDDAPTSKQEEAKNETLENSFPQEIPKEEAESEVEYVEKENKELEKYQQQVEFATYDECMKVIQNMRFGNESELFGKEKDDSFGFSCPYIAYKGQILGYRLNLDYSNPMEQ